jgi:hypothetical protein
MAGKKEIPKLTPAKVRIYKNIIFQPGVFLNHLKGFRFIPIELIKNMDNANLSLLHQQIPSKRD